MLGFFLAILLMVVLQWIPRERKKGPSTQAKPRCFAPAQTEKNREQSHSVGATNSSSAGTQTSKSPKETVGQQITVNIHKAGPISISGSREQQTLQDGYRVDWSSNLENDTAKLKEEQERTKRDLERLSDLIKSLDHRWDPSTGTEERQTWLNERKCFCAVIDDLMKQRDQLDQKLKLMERRHQEEKAALEKEKMQREQKMVSFVLRLEEKCKQLEGKLIQLKESQLRDVVLKLKKEFDVRTLIVDCGLNVLMETPAENWESVQGHQEGIIKELAGLVRDHVPKGTEGVKWHSPAQVDHKDFLASEVMRASEEKKRDHTNALAEEKERFQSTEKTGSKEVTSLKNPSADLQSKKQTFSLPVGPATTPTTANQQGRRRIPEVDPDEDLNRLEQLLLQAFEEDRKEASKENEEKEKGAALEHRDTHVRAVLEKVLNRLKRMRRISTNSPVTERKAFASGE